MGVVRISLYNLRFADTSEERYGVIEKKKILLENALG
jgi:hypothetical protein